MEKPQMFEPATSRQARVTDLDFAAFLIAEGLTLVAVETTIDPRRKTFVISGDPAQLDELTTAFARGEAITRVTAFSAARRRLRDALARGVQVPS